MEALKITGPKESMGQACSRPDLPPRVKTALRTVILSTSDVPGTEGRKTQLRFYCQDASESRKSIPINNVQDIMILEPAGTAVCCFPETVVEEDFEKFSSSITVGEKCHVNLLILEARKQAELIYGIRAITGKR